MSTHAAERVSVPSEVFSEKHEASARISAPLTPSQIAIVKSTAPVLKEHGETITKLFYEKMIRENPGLHNFFNKTGQATGAQPRALAGAVFGYANYVDDLGQLKALVERISHKHVSLTVQPEHYTIVGKYLLEAVAIVLGDTVTPEVGEAWTAAYAALADIFINREKELYAAHENWQGWRKFKIQKKIVESSEITSFHLVPEDGQALPLFKPGQYISIQLWVPELGHKQPRQYSLSEEPRSDYYRISVKKDAGQQAGLPGLISNMLHTNYNEGDTVEITHPTGDFFANPDADNTAPAVLISAGVGVTPMVSILNSIVAAGSTRPVSFVHGARSAHTQAFTEHIKSITERHPNVTATIFRSGEENNEKRGLDYHFDGRISLAKVDHKTLFLNNPNAEYFICGPTSFMNDVRRFLEQAGVNAERINLELFDVGNGE
jgi:nitric oxide dioxygenase